MKLPDTSVLVYSVNSSSPQCKKSRDWLETALSGPETVGFALVALLGFIRISTSAAVFSEPLSVEDAFGHVEAWLEPSNARILPSAPRHLENLRLLLGQVGTAGNLTTDAHLAALAIEHGATLASFDGDFHRFGELSFEYLNAPEPPRP